MDGHAHETGPADSQPTEPLAGGMLGGDLTGELAPRPVGRINWQGLWTLCAKEIRRFAKVYMQTVIAPVVTTLLFFTVFAVAFDGTHRMIGNISYLAFLGPGLVMMAITQNAFANTSSSVVIAKVQGNIVDILLPPLSASEVALGWVLGGVVRGLIVGLATTLALWLFVPVQIANSGLVLFHAISGSMMLATLGVVGGIWADKFDHIAAVTNFIVTPMTFLSGTFYSVERLPESWRFVAHLNPFFYMIDGFRAGFIGHADSNLAIGIAVGVGVNLLLAGLCIRMLRTGYKLRP